MCVDGKEAQLVFIDHAHTDMSVRNMGRKKEREGDRWRVGEKERQRKSKNREIDMSVRNMGQKEDR